METQKEQWTNKALQEEAKQNALLSYQKTQEIYEKQPLNMITNFGVSLITGDVIGVFMTFINPMLKGILGAEQKAKAETARNNLAIAIVKQRVEILKKLRELQQKNATRLQQQAEIEKIKAEQDLIIRQTAEQEKDKLLAPTANPEPTPEPETKKEMNYLAFFGFLGGSIASGGSAYYFRKNKKGFLISLFFVIVFVVLAFVFRTKKNKTENKTLNGAYNNEDNFYTPEAWANLKKLANNGIGTIDLTQNAFNFDKDKLQASLDLLNPFYGGTPLRKPITDNEEKWQRGCFKIPDNLPDADIDLWKMVGIDLTKDIFAQYATYCWHNPEASAVNNIALVNNQCNIFAKEYIPVMEIDMTSPTGQPNYIYKKQSCDYYNEYE